MGLSERQVLTQVELPLGLPLVIAGIRIATIFVIATATIASIAGGGGLGDVIVNQATYGLAGVVGASLCVSLLAFGAALLLGAAAPRGVAQTCSLGLGFKAHPTRRRGRCSASTRGAPPRRRTPSRSGSRFSSALSPRPAHGRTAADAEPDDRHRHEELHRGVRPRPAVQAGARGRRLHGLLQGEHRQLGADRHGDHERQDQLLSGVHRRHRAGPREEEVAQDRGCDVRRGEEVRADAGTDAAQRDAVLRHRLVRDARRRPRRSSA